VPGVISLPSAANLDFLQPQIGRFGPLGASDPAFIHVGFVFFRFLFVFVVQSSVIFWELPPDFFASLTHLVNRKGVVFQFPPFRLRHLFFFLLVLNGCGLVFLDSEAYAPSSFAFVFQRPFAIP